MFRRILDQFYELENKVDLGEIEFPKNIITHYGFPYSIEDFRINNPSKQEILFYKYFSHLGIIKEAPILIENRDLHTKLCDRRGLAMNNSERYKNFFLVDFLSTRASIAFELDSITHDSKKLEDQIRDEYLWLYYNISVIRYNEMDFINHLDEINEKLSINNPLDPISYRSKSDEYFYYIYKDLIKEFSELCLQHPDWINSRLNGIFLTNDDLRELGWIPDYIPVINAWSMKFCNKRIIWINTESKKKSILKKYSKGSIKRDSIYNLLQQLGYI